MGRRGEREMRRKRGDEEGGGEREMRREGREGDEEKGR